LVHVSSRYAGDPSPIEREAASAAAGGTQVFLPDDGHTVEVPYPDEA
jgi:ribonuclease Z